jgi:bla regulator protein BlaR1
MENHVKTILDLTLSGSLVVLLLYALQPLLRRISSYRVLQLLWLIVVMQFILPIDWVRASMHIPQVRMDGTITALTSTITTIQVMGPSPFPWLKLFYSIWLIGTLSILGVTFRRDIKLMSSLRRSKVAATFQDNRILEECRSRLRIRRSIRIIRSTWIPTPFLIGIFRPLVVLPEITYSEAEIRLIIEHELVHYLHHDLAWKAITRLVVAIHWFNPLVYLLRRGIESASELSCDERVSLGLSRDEIKQYGILLLSRVPQHSRIVRCGQALSGSGMQMRRRLQVIGFMGKRPRWGVIVGLLLICLIIASPLPSFTQIAAEVEWAGLNGSGIDSNLEVSFSGGGLMICPLCNEGYLALQGRIFKSGLQRLCDDLPYGIDYEVIAIDSTTLYCTKCGTGISGKSGKTCWVCNGYIKHSSR